MTDFHDYNTPSKGTQNWDEPLNQNFEDIDRDVEIRAPEDSLSEYPPKINSKFFATDTGQVYVGEGSEWARIETTGQSPVVRSVTYESSEGSTYQKQLLEIGELEEVDLNFRTDQTYSFSDLSEFDYYDLEVYLSDGGRLRVKGKSTYREWLRGVLRSLRMFLHDSL